MEEHDTPTPEFVKGFNEGYLIAKHLPELSKQLGDVAFADERGSGFKAGQQQMQVELEKDRAPDAPWWRLDYAEPDVNARTPDKDDGPDIEWEMNR